MSRIGLFGGSFDPPHAAHAQVVDNVLASGQVDEVWIVPTGDSRYDKQSRADSATRRKMVEAMLTESLGGRKVRIEPILLDEKIPDCGTMDLVDALRKAHPNHKFSFIIGADIVSQLSTWREAERLKKEVSFLVVSRGGVLLPASEFKLIEIDGRTSDISSSSIRSRVRNAENIDSLMPKSVAEIVVKQSLYL